MEFVYKRCSLYIYFILFGHAVSFCHNKQITTTQQRIVWKCSTKEKIFLQKNHFLWVHWLPFRSRYKRCSTFVLWASLCSFAARINFLFTSFAWQSIFFSQFCSENFIYRYIFGFCLKSAVIELAKSNGWLFDSYKYTLSTQFTWVLKPIQYSLVFENNKKK